MKFLSIIVIKILNDEEFRNVSNLSQKRMISLEELIVELNYGNDLSMEKIYTYYHLRLYNYSKKFLKNEDGIDDILQEVFVKVWLNRNNITNTATFNSLIYTITYNLLINELRRRLNHKNIKDEIFKLSIAEDFTNFEQTEHENLIQIINLIIDKLPIHQKQIFLLSRMEGLSHKQIAEQLTISAKTVEFHITRATKHLKEKLKSLELIS